MYGLIVALDEMDLEGCAEQLLIWAGLLCCALFRSDAQSAGTIEDWLVGLLVVWFADIKKAQAYGLSFM